jgi:hypothetical protein
MAAARSTKAVFANHTDQPSGKLAQTLPHGVWRNAAEPPSTITTGKTVWWESVSDGGLTGTEGTVRYGIGTPGAELTVHCDNPFVGRNTYDERASRGRTVLRTGGIGENTWVEYDLERTGWNTTTFRPSIHGFKFANFRPVGGTAPAGEGQPLFDYLVSRLIDSFDIPAFPLRLFGIMAPTCPDTHQGVLEPLGVMDGRSALMIREAWPKIKRWIDAGVPAPICLVKVKDSLPNKPSDDGCTISLDTARTDVVIGVGANPPDLGPVHTFIPMAYQKVTPPAIA